MKYLNIFASIFLFSIILSCMPKDNVVAIDVLLIPSKEIYNHALSLNEAIHAKNPQTIKLDEKHIPHVTLLQGFVKEDDLKEIIQILEKLDVFDNEQKFGAQELVYDKSAENSFAMIEVEKTDYLLALHNDVVEKIKPYLVKNGGSKAFVPNPDGSPIDDFTLKYVPNFLEEHSFKNYNPHISLGEANKEVLDHLNDEYFKPEKFSGYLALYQLGDSGTAQKEIWSSK